MGLRKKRLEKRKIIVETYFDRSVPDDSFEDFNDMHKALFQLKHELKCMLRQNIIPQIGWSIYTLDYDDFQIKEIKYAFYFYQFIFCEVSDSLF